MRMFLSRVLAHPGLAVAGPRVLTGSDALERTVRWVHSSEVLEIAHLLRGGELLLTGGTMLAGATEETQRSYVRRLAAREVAGVAIETGAELPAVPGAILAEAGAAGFPVIELRRVVPFVEVAEAINGLLVNDSVARLRSVGVLSHDLSGILAEGGGVQEILDALVRHVSAAASVFDTAGRLIAAGTGPSGPEPEPAGRAGGMGARITIRGVPAATLVLHPGPGADTEMLELAQERAVEALRLALLRTRPPNSRDLATSELVRVAAAGAPPQRIRRLGVSAGFAAGAPVIGIAAQATGTPAGLPELDGLLSRYGHIATHVPSPLGAHALVSLRDGRDAARTRTRLIAGLDGWSGSAAMVIAVGPVMPELSDAGASLSAAMECLQHPLCALSAGVVDASDLSIERLLLDDTVRGSLEKLVREQLGPLLALRDSEQELLVTTLETYFEAGFNKTVTAAALHLQRQSLYARLERAFAFLGGDPTGTPRALSLHLALRLHRRMS